MKRVILKSVKVNRFATPSKQNLASFYLTVLPRFASLPTSNNRCYVSGRSRGVNSRTKVSRFVLRSKVYHSNIPGCRRASW